jgi:hypothetical protein
VTNGNSPCSSARCPPCVPRTPVAPSCKRLPSVRCPCGDKGVTSARGSVSVESLVDRLFDRVLEPDERAELLIRIQAWEAANPGVDNARRVTGWIDVTYEFHAQQRAVVETRSPVRRLAVVGSWFVTSATAIPRIPPPRSASADRSRDHGGMDSPGPDMRDQSDTVAHSHRRTPDQQLPAIVAPWNPWVSGAAAPADRRCLQISAPGPHRARVVQNLAAAGSVAPDRARPAVRARLLHGSLCLSRDEVDPDGGHRAEHQGADQGPDPADVDDASARERSAAAPSWRPASDARSAQAS